MPPKLQHFRFKHGQYYYVTPRPQKWIPLGGNFDRALLEWARLQGVAPPAEIRTFARIADEYARLVILNKAPKTRVEQMRQLALLVEIFGPLTIEQIKPVDVRRYLHERNHVPVAANREIAVLSHLINKAREWGYTDAPNPCAGISRHRETGRDRYVEDAEYAALYAVADQDLRDAMDLAYFTGQRVGDVIKMKVADIRDGTIWIAQGKTKAKLRVQLVGELSAVVERCLARKSASKVVCLSPEEEPLLGLPGNRITYEVLRWRFTRARRRARVDFQFRDLRGKAATDMENLESAQKLLGHSSRAMTEHYVKARAGEKVAPVLRKMRKP